MADTISNTGNTSQGIPDTPDSFSDQNVVSKRDETEHRQPSVEKGHALRTCQERLDANGSKSELLDNMSEQSSSISPDELTAEEKLENLEKLEKRFNELLPRLTSVFTGSEKKAVQKYVDVDEYGLALETLAAIVNEQSKTISQEMFSSIKETAAMMRMDMADIESRLTEHVSDG